MKLIRRCLRCRSEFTTNRSTKVFCCETCRRRDEHSRWKKRQSGHLVDEEIMMAKTCKNCGREFIPSKHHPNQEYCVDARCQHVARALREKARYARLHPNAIHKGQPRKCVICGKEFVADTLTKICSDECRKVAQSRWNLSSRHRHVPKSKKNCVICGKEFEGNKNAKTCSEECRLALKRARKHKSNAKWKQAHSNQPIYKTCPQCGKTFKVVKMQKFCCVACRVAAYASTKITKAHSMSEGYMSIIGPTRRHLSLEAIAAKAAAKQKAKEAKAKAKYRESRKKRIAEIKVFVAAGGKVSRGICTRCGKSFLYKHFMPMKNGLMRDVTAPNGRRSFCCDYCEYTYVNQVQVKGGRYISVAELAREKPVVLKTVYRNGNGTTTRIQKAKFIGKSLNGFERYSTIESLPEEQDNSQFETAMSEKIMRDNQW